MEKQGLEMIRIEKSSKARKASSKVNADYMLLYRTGKALGEKVVADALNGNEKALAKIEKYAYEPKKRPAVVAWLKSHRARLKREAMKAAKAAC
jgi:hypothetical protein